MSRPFNRNQSKLPTERAAFENNARSVTRIQEGEELIRLWSYENLDLYQANDSTAQSDSEVPHAAGNVTPHTVVNVTPHTLGDVTIDESDDSSDDKSETFLELSDDETFYGSLGSGECRQSVLPVNAHLDNLSVTKNSQEYMTANPSNAVPGATRQLVLMPNLTVNQERVSRVTVRPTPAGQNTNHPPQQL